MVSAQQVSETSHRAVAPAGHTVVVLLILLGLSPAGACSGNLPGIGAHGPIAGYALVSMTGAEGYALQHASARARAEAYAPA
jgi:hypothetical protein